MLIQDLLGNPVISCDPTTTLADAARKMCEHDVGSLAVMRHDALIGLVTERDLIRAIADDTASATATVDSWMTYEPDTVDADVDVAEAAEWMLTTGYRHLPVITGSEVSGIISIKDLLWAVTGQQTGR